MNTKFKKPVMLGVCSLLLIGGIVSCNKDSDEKSLISSEENLSDMPVNDSSLLSGVCTTPALPRGQTGSGQQTCNDDPKPVNTGKLDCRVTGIGGYTQSPFTFPSGTKVMYGVYKLEGGTKRYPDTKTRVERYFVNLARGANKVYNFKCTFQINDLSDSETNFAQAHHGGLVRSGTKKNETATSAIYGVQAVKNATSGKSDIIFSESDIAYTTASSGHRKTTNLITLDNNIDYTMEIKAGYNASSNFVVNIKIFKTSKTSESVSKTFTYLYGSDTTYLRYGSYVANDTGDKTSEIRFRGVTYCVE